MFIIVGSITKFGGTAILSFKKEEKPHFRHNKNYSYELQMFWWKLLQPWFKFLAPINNPVCGWLVELNIGLEQIGSFKSNHVNNALNYRV